MSDSPLLVEHRSDLVIARLNRPHKRNAIDREMIDALHALCDDLESAPRILILSGTGADFAAGADIAQLRARRADDARRGINASAFIRIRELPMPVIAALDGYALGGGAELAYAADIRIATPRLRIGNPEPDLGIIAAAGAAWRLREIIGDGRASEMLLTGRILTADEALLAGLISGVHNPDDLMPAAQTIAERIASAAPLAIQHTKTALRAPRDAHPAIDGDLQAELFESHEKMRRMTEFLERKGRP